MVEIKGLKELEKKREKEMEEIRAELKLIKERDTKGLGETQKVISELKSEEDMGTSKIRVHLYTIPEFTITGSFIKDTILNFSNI